ncbi:MAG TPA: MBL fold metallo-hydrolase [Longimicrobium sp.]|nr:MBL fold metallo-hydrolase [Longimicrobium sp.]
MQSRIWRIATVLTLFVATGCTVGMSAVRNPPYSYAAATAPPWSSMVYAARTDSGVVVVDLGWYGAERELRGALRKLGATPADVTDVFLTHSHRDHIGAWRLVRHARFHLAASEEEFLGGAARHGDLPSRTAEAVLGNPGPWPGEVAVSPFARDTAFVFGADTLRAYPLPGHTPGSAAYLFRRVLFLGDAFAYHRITGLRGAEAIFSADRERSAANLRALIERVRPLGMEWACNAHSKCLRPDSAFTAGIRD